MTARNPAAKPRHPRPTGFKFTRRVKGVRFQARLYLGPAAGHVNLGLYRSPEAAAAAARAVGARLRGLCPLDVWEAVQPLIAAGVVRDTVLPKYVFRRPDGRYGARLRHGARRAELGPFDDPADACRAMLDHLAGDPA